MENNKVVYAHRRSDTKEVFYIGMGNLERAYSKERSKDWHDVVLEHGYEVVIIATDLSEVQAWDVEAGLIYLHDINNLVNVEKGNRDAVDRRRGKASLRDIKKEVKA